MLSVYVDIIVANYRLSCVSYYDHVMIVHYVYCYWLLRIVNYSQLLITTGNI